MKTLPPLDRNPMNLRKTDHLFLSEAAGDPAAGSRIPRRVSLSRSCVKKPLLIECQRCQFREKAIAPSWSRSPHPSVRLFSRTCARRHRPHCQRLERQGKHAVRMIDSTANAPQEAGLRLPQIRNIRGRFRSQKGNTAAGNAAQNNAIACLHLHACMIDCLDMHAWWRHAMSTTNCPQSGQLVSEQASYGPTSYTWPLSPNL